MQCQRRIGGSEQGRWWGTGQEGGRIYRERERSEELSKYGAGWEQIDNVSWAHGGDEREREKGKNKGVLWADDE